MKILHCINSLDIGGAEKTLVRLINSSNHKHRIITILDSQLLKSFLKKDVQLLSIFPLNLKRILEIIKFIRDFDPDLFQGWMYHGDLTATLLGICFKKPIFWNIRHGKMSLKYSSKKTILLRNTLAIFSHIFPKKIISCSFCGVSVHQKIGYAFNKFHVIHNGIDIKRKSYKKYLNLLTKKDIKICSIGRNNPQKNRIYFINIVKELSKSLSIESLILGKGVSRSPELKKFCNLSAIKLDLKESIKDIGKIFDEIDILIVTSVYGEGCPNVIIEALKNGILVFSTDVGDAKYILGDDRFIIPSNNYQIAANKIKQVALSNNIDSLIIDSRLRSDKLFNERRMSREYDKIWFA